MAADPPPPRKKPRGVWNAPSYGGVPYAAGRFIAEVCEKAESCGSTPMMIGIDGRSGSGKSTVARKLSEALAGRGISVATVQLDQLCPGWHGLDRAVDLVMRWVILPIRSVGTAGAPRYRRWDWYTSGYAEWVDVQPAEGCSVIIIEGCGIGSARTRKLLDSLAWVEAPEPVRRARALAREREFLASAAEQLASAEQTEPDAEVRDPLWWWPVWAGQEAAILARERIDVHAQIVENGDHPRHGNCR